MWRKRSGAEVPVAVKRVEMVTSTQDERDAAFNELEILEMVSHPNVIAYYGFSFYNSNDQASIFLLFELMDHALDKFVDKCDAIWSENEKLDILSQICRGMSYLHTRTPSVVHGDLAARNVLLKKHPVYYKKFIAKITDLGLAKTCRDELYTKYDNPNKIPFKWCPPEVLASQILTPKSDVWMFGVLCFEVCDKTGEPYGIVGASNLPQYLNDGYRHDRGQHMSETIYDLALNCMRTEAADRPSF
uniref:Protein kinase domain-containing protein n=1 Tax=Caenorhabditis japonica TaxID=281687 RepID=A0A8R1I4T2_CAEJA